MEIYMYSLPEFKIIVSGHNICRHSSGSGYTAFVMPSEWKIIMYIDPGTGSMLFTVLLGSMGTLIYFIRVMFIKVRFGISGRNIAIDKKKIPFVIFSDDKRYWNVFKPICREMNALGKNVVYLTMSHDDPALQCEYPHIKAEYIGTGNKAFAKLNMLNAVIVLSTTPGLDVYQWKRSKNVDYYVHIPHAANDISLYKMFGLDYYDSVLLSGEYQRECLKSLEKLRGISEKDTEIVGIPYMDEMKERLQNSKAVPSHPVTVLLAPSWGKSAILSVYGDKIIEALLKTDFNVIIRPHPQSFKSETEMIKRLTEKYPASDRLEWNNDTDNFEVLRRSDILISDFSGVIFDFALVYNKPVIYTSPDFDLSVYDAWWLDEPLWTLSALERIGTLLTDENINDLDKLIKSCIEEPKYEKGRAEVRNETWQHCGEGAKRTAVYLAKKYDELTASDRGD